MACTLTRGRALPSKSTVGGLEAIYFADYGSLGATTIVAGEITVIAGTPDFFKYDIKGNSSLETTINSSREAGTTFYTSTLNMTLTALDKETQEQLKLLVSQRPHSFVKTYDGKYFCIGLKHGTEVTGGTIVTGAAMGDLTGFTLVLEAQETAPPFFVTESVIIANEQSDQIIPIACS